MMKTASTLIVIGFWYMVVVCCKEELSFLILIDRARHPLYTAEVVTVNLGLLYSSRTKPDFKLYTLNVNTQCRHETISFKRSL